MLGTVAVVMRRAGFGVGDGEMVDRERRAWSFCAATTRPLLLSGPNPRLMLESSWSTFLLLGVMVFEVTSEPRASAMLAERLNVCWIL